MNNTETCEEQSSTQKPWNITAIAECPTGLCENCGMPVVFMLKQDKQELSLDLFTVLNCLKLAADRGHIPRIPNDWWLDIVRSYGEDVKP